MSSETGSPVEPPKPSVIYTAIVTYVILKVLDMVIGLRVTEEEEAVGLDLAQHNERGYNL